MKLFITTMFYIILLCGAWWGGYKLIENTKPSSSKELDRLISAIKELKINQRRISGINNKSHKETTTEYLIASKMDPSGKYLPLGKTVEKTNIVPGQEEQSIISEKDLDTLLKSVAFAARKEAVDEYKSNFSVLLTILTIFGIAWPVIVGLLNFKFNERELDKITNALDSLSDTIKEIKCFQKETYISVAKSYYLNAIFWGKEMSTGKDQNNYKMELNGRRCFARALITGIYYYALADELGKADSKVGIVISELEKMQGLSPKDKTSVIDEVDWNKFISMRIKRAKEIKRLADNVFCNPVKSEEV